ncbi:UDP-N-acetylmuramate dehydrogenase [Candidatus Soleaferrea massiliensis]|uniref:UDP-N-acetylmuramate dehydrogenase n=1 Tax=Candidatus Soleaferrea massiliensis TaxID=1470354 RepID=UPI000694C73E|nr:UDP-N-acetylmuramate dehydrogenase [Candidatus Soleaferrea massiliensis]
MDYSALCEEFEGRNCAAKLDAPLKNATTFRIGGNAQLLVRPRDEEAVRYVIRRCYEEEIPCTLLGKGSNVLISDEGVKGVVMILSANFSGVEVRDGTTLVCLAGTPLARVCYVAYQHGLTGLEFAWGIPGTVGGAAYMNAGAYGGEMKDVIRRCEHVTPDGEAGSLEKDDLQLSYRHSAYTDNGCCITRVVLQLEKGGRDAIRARMDDLMHRRKTKQPLEYPSAGSTFKRPEGAYASALIDQCGLKGFSHNGAQVSEKHAGFVINQNGATAKDVLELIRIVQEVVLAKTGFSLECEVKIIK